MDDIQVTSDLLEFTSNQSFAPDCGATSTFLGTTRSDLNDEGAHVTKLFYEAYVPMALKEMKKICTSIRSKWENIGSIRIAHRIGDVYVGEISLIISVSAKRRDAAIRGVEFAIEELKVRVPIWKKEYYSNDNAVWKANQRAPFTSKKIFSGNEQANIQITASNEEIQRRIESFAERKRLEVDRNNILEFCNRHYSDENDYSCARTDSILIRRQGSSSHYRKSKVVNTGNGANTSTSPASASLPAPKMSRGTEERLKVLEDHLLPGKPIDKDIFARIKALEDRVLYLEGISPEYFSNQSKDSQKTETSEKDKEYVPKEERKSDLTNMLMEANLKILELENEAQIKNES